MLGPQWITLPFSLCVSKNHSSYSLPRTPPLVVYAVIYCKLFTSFKKLYGYYRVHRYLQGSPGFLKLEKWKNLLILILLELRFDKTRVKWQDYKFSFSPSWLHHKFTNSEVFSFWPEFLVHTWGDLASWEINVVLLLSVLITALHWSLLSFNISDYITDFSPSLIRIVTPCK